MKILFSSHFFPPSIGGLQEVGALVAEEFSRRGHEVIVITQTPEEEPFPCEVRRNPGPLELLRLTRWSDIVFHNNISLRTAWPLLLIRRPWVVAHHTWLTRTDGRRALIDRLKSHAIRAATNVAVSQAIAAQLGVPTRVIPNPYRDQLFRKTNEGIRESDVIFLGRLVSDKGVDLLIDALSQIRPALRATIVGDGPERPSLEAQANRLGVEVRFTGPLRGAELVAILNEHRFLVMPSRWEEPFGVAALEGMACGCIPVVARSGGLPEAVGAAGAVFAKENARALAECLESLRSDEARLAELRSQAPAHLARHRAAVIAAKYLEVLEEAAR